MANFITKKIKSKYLDKEFDVSCWEMGEESRKLTIIEHAAFEDIVFNQLTEEVDIEYALEPIIGVANYPVMKCIMKDVSGRCITAIGEAHPDSLVNNISRQNPVIMAGNRAFDRAAIRYLNLEGKVYSSEEIPSEEEKEPVSKKIPETKVEDVVIDESVRDSSIGDTVINFGNKYKGKGMTVAQIWETDESWARYAAKMNTEKAGNATIEQIEAIKAYGKQIKKLKD